MATRNKPQAARTVQGVNINPLQSLDARPDRLDFRDLTYRAPLRSLPARFPADEELKQFLPGYVKAGLVLNQGNEGACTGFGLACVTNYLLWRRHLEDKAKEAMAAVSPRMFYELAKHYDEWPGQDYDGSSCRGALKGWHKHGVCSDRHWPYPLDAAGKPSFVRPSEGWASDATRRPLGVYYRIDKMSVVDLQAAIMEIGAVYVAATVHDGWSRMMLAKPLKAPKRHAELPVIGALQDPAQTGGHAFALVGYNERGFIVQNSWGGSWGAAGFAVLSYEDWVTNSTDAWAVALGVAQTQENSAAPRSSSYRLSLGRSMGGLARTSRVTNNPPDDPWPIDHEFLHKPYEPWSTERAYTHTLLSGNEGHLMVTDFTRQRSDGIGQARDILVERPLQWIKGSKGKTLKLAIYAHGGLNAEAESIQRIRVLAPYFEANGVYPVFFTWKTGVAETISDMMEDWVQHLLGLSGDRASAWLDLGDAKDRAIEAAGRTLVRGLWSEMRENAAGGSQPGHALSVAAARLRELRERLTQAGVALELHLIGHSAGSILLGHLLDQLGGAAPLQVQTCNLYAAACSSGFAVQHYLGASRSGVLALAHLHLYQLSDKNERNDGLPSESKPVYGKSLLYLVSRALDDVRKQPLLGMERALLPDFAKDKEQWDRSGMAAMQQWQAAWNPLAAQHGLLHKVETPKVRNTREQGQISATHGSFDNNIDVLTDTLARIKGAALVAPLEWLDY